MLPMLIAEELTPTGRRPHRTGRRDLKYGLQLPAAASRRRELAAAPAVAPRTRHADYGGGAHVECA